MTPWILPHLPTTRHPNLQCLPGRMESGTTQEDRESAGGGLGRREVGAERSGARPRWSNPASGG